MRELTLPAPLVLLPGMGADGRVYARQREAFGEAFVVPDWIDPTPHEPLHRYAKRWAEALSPTLPETWFLAGQSFGGMLALDLVRYVEPRPRGVFLIASARNPDAIGNGARLLGGLAKPLSAEMLHRSLKLIALPFAKLNGADDELAVAIRDAVADSDPELLEWSIAACLDWDGPGGDPAALPPVRQVHGRRDAVLRCDTDRCDQVIADGQHLIHYSHARTVNRFLFDHIVALTPGADMDYPRAEDPDVTAARRVALTG